MAKRKRKSKRSKASYRKAAKKGWAKRRRKHGGKRKGKR